LKLIVSCVVKNMEVSSPPGTVIGSIQQEWSILTPQFNIKNAAGDVVLKIEGPICTFSICGDVEFTVGFLSLCHKLWIVTCFLIRKSVLQLILLVHSYFTCHVKFYNICSHRCKVVSYFT
jgi:hypothetical protein